MPDVLNAPTKPITLAQNVTIHSSTSTTLV
jgi:hypothetical protein